MTLSLSSSVRLFVSPFVMKEFFFSLRSYKGVSWKQLKYQGWFMQVSWIESFKVVSRKIQESFNVVLREF